MKLFFFFLLFLPCASALAVTPTALTVTDTTGATLYVYNTLNETMEFQVKGLYAENFSLKENGVKELSIPSPGKSGQILVQEIYKQGFINAVVIPVDYKQTRKSGVNLRAIPLGIGSSIIVALVFLGMYSWKRKKQPVFKEKIAQTFK